MLNRFRILNRYYQITKFYGFLKSTSIKGGIILAIFVAVFVILDYFILDTQAILNSIVTNYSTGFILSIFLLSETIFGLLPPEIFIAWSSKTENPFLYLFFLGSISYLGGIFAYFIGKLIYSIPTVRLYLEQKIAIHIMNLRKWGGFFIIVGALLLLPHAVVGMACGLIKYDFRYYLLWALFRFPRFFLYGLLVFELV